MLEDVAMAMLDILHSQVNDMIPLVNAEYASKDLAAAAYLGAATATTTVDPVIGWLFGSAPDMDSQIPIEQYPALTAWAYHKGNIDDQDQWATVDADAYIEVWTKSDNRTICNRRTLRTIKAIERVFQLEHNATLGGLVDKLEQVPQDTEILDVFTSYPFPNKPNQAVYLQGGRVYYRIRGIE
jgi:hypothetical protein